MANIFVRTTGNDTTGNGSSGTPYATLVKALTVAVAGDRIVMGSGTYAENSGSGYLQLTTTFASYVVVTSETGKAEDVIITSASLATQAFGVGNCSYVVFDKVTIRSFGVIDATSNCAVRFLGAASNIRFVECIFDVISTSAAVATAITSSWDSAAATVSNIDFIDCKVKQTGQYPCRGVYLQASFAGTNISKVRFIGCRVDVGHDALFMSGITNLEVIDNKFISWSREVGGQGIRIGIDGSTGANTTGFVTGNTVVATTGHAAVIGAGCSDIHVHRNTFYGGDHSGNGQGLVVKNTTGGRITDNIVYGGALSGLYLKAAQGMLIEGNTVYNRYSTSSALRAGLNNENNSKISKNVVRDNIFYANVGTLISWDGASGDAGGNVVDQNVYNLAGSATWGSVRGTTIASLAALKAAWNGYDRPGNDNNSRSGVTAMRHKGDRKLALS